MLWVMLPHDHWSTLCMTNMPRLAVGNCLPQLPTGPSAASNTSTSCMHVKTRQEYSPATPRQGKRQHQGSGTESANSVRSSACSALHMCIHKPWHFACICDTCSCMQRHLLCMQLLTQVTPVLATHTVSYFSQQGSTAKARTLSRAEANPSGWSDT